MCYWRWPRWLHELCTGSYVQDKLRQSYQMLDCHSCHMHKCIWGRSDSTYSLEFSQFHRITPRQLFVDVRRFRCNVLRSEGRPVLRSWGKWCTSNRQAGGNWSISFHFTPSTSLLGRLTIKSLQTQEYKLRVLLTRTKLQLPAFNTPP